MFSRHGSVRSVGLAAAAACLGALLTQNLVRADISSGDRPAFVAIAPCRLVDTRAGSNTVGPRAEPLGPDETMSVEAHGTNGECAGASAIPSDALALAMNVTALGATQQTYLTFWGAGSNPGTANLNPAPAQPPTPNAVTTPLSESGSFNVYNFSGNVNVVIDVNGYYAHHDHDDRYDTSAEVDSKISTNIADAIDALPDPPEPPEPAAPTRLTPNELGRLDWDADRGKEMSAPFGSNPRDLTWDGTHIWASLRDDDAVIVIDPITMQEVDRIPVQDSPSGIAFDGSRILVTNKSSHSLSVIDVASRSLIEHVPTAQFPLGVASDDQQIYVAGNSSLTVIDRTDLSITTTVTGLEQAQGVAVAGGFVYVAENNAARVAVFDTSDNLPDSPIGVGEGTRYIASTGVELFVTNQGDGTVSVIDVATRAVVDTILIGADRQLIGIVYDGQDIWVSDNDHHELYRIDARSHEIVEGPIPTDDGPVGMVYNGTNVFVSNINDDTIQRWLAR